MLYSYGDVAKHYRFINEISDTQERKRTEQNLQQIVSYAETSDCRRKFLLSYFGQETDSLNHSCAACDNCTGTLEKVDATAISQKIMSAILRTGERYGGGYIADILCGKKDDKIIIRGHDALSVYGIAADFKKTQIMRIINALCGIGIIVRQGQDYPVYAVTPQGKQVLRDREPILLSAHCMSRPKKEPRPSYVNTAAHPLLFDQLRMLRKKFAQELNVPPYVIFGDRTLQEMCHSLPATRDDLSSIFGVGSKKLTQFGDAFLEIIDAYRKSSGE